MVGLEVFNIGLAILVGLIIGLFYDIYRTFLHHYQVKIKIYSIFDFLFTLISAGILGFFCLIINYGALRWWIFVGFLVGFLVWIFLISPFFIHRLIRLVFWFWNRCKSILGLIKRILYIIFTPFIFMANSLYSLANLLVKITIKLRTLTGKIVVQIKKILKSKKSS